jgi:hypothetical protein
LQPANLTDVEAGFVNSVKDGGDSQAEMGSRADHVQDSIGAERGGGRKETIHDTWYIFVGLVACMSMDGKQR